LKIIRGRKKSLSGAAFLAILAALAVSATALAAGSQAGEPPGSSMEALSESPSLEYLITYAYAHNPLIHAKKSALDEARQKTAVAGAWSDPQLSLGFWPGFWSDSGDQKWTAAISQEVPLPGKTAAARRAAQAAAVSGRIAVDAAVKDMVTAVTVSFHELVYLRGAQELARQNRAALESMAALAGSAYAGNRAALVDVMKAKSQAAQAALDLIYLAESEKTELARLNALLDRPPDAPLGRFAPALAEPVAYTLSEIYCLARVGNSEILMARAEIASARAEYNMARYETYPETMLGLMVEKTDPADGGMAEPDNMVGLELGLSLPVWGAKNSGRRNAALAAVEKALAGERGMTNDILSMIRETWFKMENARRLVELYRESLIPQAARSMETARSWYRQGLGSLSDAVEIESSWYSFRLALLRAETDHAQNLARLEGLAGARLTVKDASDPCSEKGAQ